MDALDFTGQKGWGRGEKGMGGDGWGGRRRGKVWEGMGEWGTGEKSWGRGKARKEYMGGEGKGGGGDKARKAKVK